MMFGTWLAVAYALPRQNAWTVCAKTSWRPNPTIRAAAVSDPMSTAARPIPRPAPVTSATSPSKRSSSWVQGS